MLLKMKHLIEEKLKRLTKRTMEVVVVDQLPIQVTKK